MRSFVVVVFIIGASACTKHNPDSCCATVEQCGELGISGITPCDTGRTCDTTGTCVAAQCTTSPDCTSADAPICENQLCVAKCTTDDECVGIAGRPHCDTDGACVACTMSSQCTDVSAAICDTSVHECRGCASDSDCPGGICLESEGTCKADSDVFFLTANGVDSGNCTRAAPCATIPFVLAKSGSTYKYIHILGGTYDVGASTLNIDQACYIDGSGTTIKGAGGMPVLHFGYGLGGGVLNDVTVQGSTNPPSTVAMKVDIGATLKIFSSTIQHGITMDNAHLTVEKSTFTVPTAIVAGIDCTNGDLTITQSEFDGSFVNAQTCNVTMSRNKFDSTGQCFTIVGGLSTVENNQFIAHSEQQDCGVIFTAGAGSMVRFNTFVNLSDLISDGSPLHCDQSATITSNIFAWGSTAPNAGGCAPTYSLFDTATTEPITGTGSFMADSATFFVNKTAKDFHLAPNSPAIGKAESGLNVTVDIEGNPRPASTPDIGAFEAP